MKKLLVLLMLSFTMTMTAQIGEIRISVNGIVGKPYVNHIELSNFDFLSPSIIIARNNFLIGASVKSVYVEQNGYYNTIDDDDFFWVNLGYKVAHNTFMHLNIGRRKQTLTFDKEMFGPYSTPSIGLGIIYFSSNKHYTIGTDFKIYDETKGRIYPSLTLGYNFTPSDFQNFINFIK